MKSLLDINSTFNTDTTVISKFEDSSIEIILTDTIPRILAYMLWKLQREKWQWGDLIMAEFSHIW